MIYVLAYPLFETRVVRSLTAFRTVHEPDRAQLVAPHVTLVFGVRNSYPEDMVTICKRVAATTPAISAEFSKAEISYDPFERKHKISLLCGKGAGPLTSLHERLYAGPHRGELHRDVPYSPHMTVGTNADISKLKNADIASISDFPIKAEIDGLSVVQLTGGELRAICSIELAKPVLPPS